MRLKDISFHIRPGQSIALLGSTGSGKTSLVNLLPRFHDYTGGSIRLDGAELRDYPRAYLRQQIGIVQQEPFLFSRSIRENILYGVGHTVSSEQIEAAAKAAAVHDVILSFPHGYDTLVGEKGVTLSGGQKQRITIARTLLKNPRILILDDSTSSVDTETEAEIRAALYGLMQDRTTFIIAHRIQSLMHADLILVLDKGRILQMRPARRPARGREWHVPADLPDPDTHRRRAGERITEGANVNAQGRKMSPATSQDFGLWLTRQLGLNLMKLALGLNRTAKARSRARTALESVHSDEFTLERRNKFAGGTQYATGIISVVSAAHGHTRPVNSKVTVLRPAKSQPRE